MSYEDVFREVYEDVKNAIAYCSHQNRRVSEAARKAAAFPCTLITEYTSPRKNRWLIIHHIFRKNVHNGGCGILFGCLQKFPRGFALHLLMLNDFEKIVITFHPHFFDRYAERLGLDLAGISLVKRAVRRMSRIKLDDTPKLSGRNDRGEGEIHCLMDDGIGLGDRLSHFHVLIKTFITYDMTNGRQEKVFTYIKDKFEDAYEKHKRIWRKVKKEKVNR